MFTSNRRNVVFVNPMLSTTDALPYYNVQMFNLAKGLRKYFNIAIITKKHKISTKPLMRLDGTSVYFTKSIRIPLLSQMFYALGEYLNGIERLLDRLKAEIVISAEDFSLTTLRIVKYCKKRMISSIVYHGPYFYTGFPLGVPHIVYSKSVGKYVYENANLFVAKTQKAADFLTHVGCNPRKIVVVPPCIDMDLFNPKRHDNTLISASMHDKKILLFVGHLSKEKNPIPLIFAFSKLKKECNDVALLIVTQGGKMQPRVEQLIRSLGLQNDVHIMMNIPNTQMAVIYSKAYATVSSSLIEIFGMNILESLACGTPVIATPTPGSFELIKHNVNGLITKDFSPEKLFACMSTLITDKKLYRKLRQNARPSVKNQYNITRIAKNWANLLMRQTNTNCT